MSLKNSVIPSSSKTVTQLVVDFQCPGCIPTIQYLIHKANDVVAEEDIDLEVDLHTKLATITTKNPSKYKHLNLVEVYSKTLKEGGFDVSSYTVVSHHIFKGLTGIGFSLLISIPLMMNLIIPLPVLALMALGTTIVNLYLGWTTYTKAFKQLFYAKTFSMDSLFAISSLSSLAISFLALLHPIFPFMFADSLSILGFKHFGDAIKKTCSNQIVKGLSLLELAPQVVKRYENKTYKETKITDLKENQIYSLNPGEYLPTDALLISSNANFNTSLLDGKRSYYTTFKKGAALKAGLKLTSNKAVQFKVLKNVAASELAQIDQQLAKNNNKKSQIEESSTTVLQFFIPAIITIAIICGGFTASFASITTGIYTLLSCLNAACPCALGSIIPAVFSLGLRNARGKCVEFKNTSNIEVTSNVDCVVLDLHGTLTNADTEVVDVDVNQHLDLSKNRIHTILLSLEAESNHRIAHAIRRFLKNHTLDHIDIKNRTLSYNMVSATIDNTEYFITNETYFRKSNIKIDFFKPNRNQDDIVYLAQKSNDITTILARVRLNETLRNDARSLIVNLEKSGKQIYLCTGGSKDDALKAGKTLGIHEKNIRYEYSPQQKNEFINSLKKNFTVAMVADEKNDLLSLSASDIGIAVTDSDIHVNEKADILIKTDTLSSIHFAFEAAQHTKNIVNKVIISSIAYNLIALALVGVILPSVGILVPPGLCFTFMIAQMSIATLYVLRKSNLNFDDHEINQKNSVNYNDEQIETTYQSSHTLMAKYDLGATTNKQFNSSGIEEISSEINQEKPMQALETMTQNTTVNQATVNSQLRSQCA